MDFDETWQDYPSCDHPACWPRSYSSRNYDRFVSHNTPVTRSKPTFWTILWRRIKKQKKRMFQQRSSSMRFTYDSYSYSQNFDQGSIWDDSNDLGRSFSARFAVPSRIFEENRLMF
ncbi:hypothetical protein CDL12_21011 [Handroanthus impetiginosus]|uniref:Uncharacterized protein n=1 Tax=Handroanthus impetiginosus TaxID=429701 RepID=A0A2G9GGN5_9LAMI|nr:hypothetical protein CDL12_23008 [Handroanthus impetiginosus]PIN06442.1 hypothetical protein CDL12_21011 [Handroanthus impetiginosus]